MRYNPINLKYKTLCIMQPYFFPYIGYFQLINYVDYWIVFDRIQFIHKGWVNRNRILHPDMGKEWQYITVPLVKHSRTEKIQNIQINNSIQWREQIIGKLTSYKKKALFYKETVEFVSGCLDFNTDNLNQLVIHTLEKTCEYLEIPFNYQVFSKMNLKIDDVYHPGQWALEISDLLNASVYVNPHSGYAIFNEHEYKERGVELQFLKPNLAKYVQRRDGFVPGLSIIDVMMWNDKDRIKKMLLDFDIINFSQLARTKNG